MKIKLLLALQFITVLTFAQEKEIQSKLNVNFSGYLDAYYSYDFDESTKEPFLYNYNRHNEFNLNIAVLKASISYDNVYGKLAIQTGTYVEDNYGVENTKLLNEACLGVHLNKSKTTTIEAGILPSYIGFETAVSHSNLNVTRSILAENSPYFMTGVKFNHQFSNKLSLGVLATNGWQRIQRANSNIPPAFGTQLVYKPNDKATLNWSTFVGKESFQNDFTMRYFNNFYYDKTWNAKWRNILGFDYGIQENAIDNNKSSWYSPTLITQYSLNSKWQVAHRIEYYKDSKNVIINFGSLPFETIGNSINLDFLPNSKFKIRTEAKWFNASEKLFDSGNDFNNYQLTTTMSFEF